MARFATSTTMENAPMVLTVNLSIAVDCVINSDMVHRDVGKPNEEM